ncbi:MAG: glycoside hydrolase family 15 protein [bacterium]|nr:glycoside hydrolase family 15 protein [bacterium]MDZ4284206.1 glycoside hydrolase family 15 protein [Patescibacteria group bacterium]
MPLSLVLGNGEMLVGLDNKGQVRDLYQPHPGLENHVGAACVHRIGVFVDGRFSWLSEESWRVGIIYEPQTLVSEIQAVHAGLGVQLHFTDVVYNEEPIFVRRLRVRQTGREPRTIKIFFHQQFQIYGTAYGNTALYDPKNASIVHYRGRRVFLVSGIRGGKSFDDFSIGVAGIEGKEGTWRDAEDGALSKNAVEHGAVDSVIAFTLPTGSEQSEIYYWIAAGATLAEARERHDLIKLRSPEHIIESTGDFWRAWSRAGERGLEKLPAKIAGLFTTSLLVIRAHLDHEGGIIASADSEMLKYGRDSYAYVWMRDAALAARALDCAGYPDTAEPFYQFCADTLMPEGYFYHKYLPDKSLGSSWHPWVRGGKEQLGIQEDQTATVLFELWGHYESSRNLEFIERLYNPLIKRTATFLVTYRDRATGLPLPSYDLWEERYGVSTYTAASVFGGLRAAARFAELLGKEQDARDFSSAAEEVRTGILKYLINSETGYFLKQISYEHDEPMSDPTLDTAGFAGVFRFGILEPDDKRLRKAAESLRDWLCCKTPFGGAARYEGDMYYRADARLPGNPWIISTLWYAQYLIAIAEKTRELEEALVWLNWTVDRANGAGMLPEQVDPHTGAPVSASPLVWSHAEFVYTVLQYLAKLKELEK